jgi:hypothetical protein
MSESMLDFILRTESDAKKVGDHLDWTESITRDRMEREDRMFQYAVESAGTFLSEFNRRESVAGDRLSESLRKHGVTATPINKSKYPSRKGLEGPFRYRTGAVLYYDPKEQRYYDSGRDMYLDNEEALMIMGVMEDMVEDENRSDSEFAVFFNDRAVAVDAFRYAQAIGLESGEVTFDQSVNPMYGLGRYAVRLAPEVRYTKPDIFLDFLDALYDRIEDEDVDQYEWVMAEAAKYLSEVTDAEKKGLKKLSKKKAATDPDNSGCVSKNYDYNPNHDRGGNFSSSEEIKADKFRGSMSYKSKWSKRAKGKKKGNLMCVATKLPCGRKARGANVPMKDRYRRCWDGEQAEWAFGAGGPPGGA